MSTPQALTPAVLLRPVVHAASLLPLAVLLWDAGRGNLSVNPIQEITLRTGEPAVILLALSLACTPAALLLGLRQALPVRRTLGLYAFFYASLHFLIFAVVDYGLDWSLIVEAVVEKRYVLAGFAAFVLLLPLALTSTTGWQRRLKRRWKTLHRVVYAAAGLAILHWVWLKKSHVERSEPLLWGLAVAVLLLLRLPWVRRALTRKRLRPGTQPGL